MSTSNGQIVAFRQNLVSRIPNRVRPLAPGSSDLTATFAGVSSAPLTVTASDSAPVGISLIQLKVPSTNRPRLCSCVGSSARRLVAADEAVEITRVPCGAKGIVGGEGTWCTTSGAGNSQQCRETFLGLAGRTAALEVRPGQRTAYSAPMDARMFLAVVEAPFPPAVPTKLSKLHCAGYGGPGRRVHLQRWCWTRSWGGPPGAGHRQRASASAFRHGCAIRHCHRGLGECTAARESLGDSGCFCCESARVCPRRIGGGPKHSQGNTRFMVILEAGQLSGTGVSCSLPIGPGVCKPGA